MAIMTSEKNSTSTAKSGTSTDNSSSSSLDHNAGTKRSRGIKSLKNVTTKLRNKATETMSKLREVIDRISDEDSIPEPEDRIFRGGFKNSSQTNGMYVEDPDAFIEAIMVQKRFARRYGYEECPILEEALQNHLRELGRQSEYAKPVSEASRLNKLTHADDKLAYAADQLEAGKHESEDSVGKVHALERSWDILPEDEEDDTPFTLGGTPFSASSACRLATESRPSSSTSSRPSSLGSATEKVPQAWLNAPTPPPRSTTSRNSSLAHVAEQHKAEWKAKTTLPLHTSTSTYTVTAFDSVVDMSPEQYVPGRASWSMSTTKLNDRHSLPSQRKTASFPADAAGSSQGYELR